MFLNVPSLISITWQQKGFFRLFRNEAHSFCSLCRWQRSSIFSTAKVSITRFLSFKAKCFSGVIRENPLGLELKTWNQDGRGLWFFRRKPFLSYSDCFTVIDDLYLVHLNFRLNRLLVEILWGKNCSFVYIYESNWSNSGIFIHWRI